MKAIRLHEPIGTEGLRYEEAPDPVPAFGDVVVRVHACGITPTKLYCRREYLAATAHELRLPLSHIKGFVSSLRRTDVHWDETTRHDFLAEIEVEADRLANLVDALIQAGAANDTEAPASIRVLTSATALIEAGLHRVRCPLRNRQVSVEVPAGLPPLCVDPDGIERVLANLLQNAAKYSPPTGAIWVSARLVGRSRLELSVQDEGPGVPLEDRQRIFQPFFRTRTSQQGNAPGHGLGLAVCKSIVLAHGGSITLEERRGGGANFTVLLPVPLRAARLGDRNKNEDRGYDPADNSCCGRRSTHAQARRQQSQSKWLRRAHGGRWDGGTEADGGAPIRPAAA